MGYTRMKAETRDVNHGTSIYYTTLPPPPLGLSVIGTVSDDFVIIAKDAATTTEIKSKSSIESLDNLRQGPHQMVTEYAHTQRQTQGHSENRTVCVYREEASRVRPRGTPTKEVLNEPTHSLFQKHSALKRKKKSAPRAISHIAPARVLSTTFGLPTQRCAALTAFSHNTTSVGAKTTLTTQHMPDNMRGVRVKH